MSTDAKGISVESNKKEGECKKEKRLHTVDPDETARKSGPTLFAQVFVLLCLAESINSRLSLSRTPRDSKKTSRYPYFDISDLQT